MGIQELDYLCVIGTPVAKLRQRVLGAARVQQELVLVDAGTIQGYRVASWYLPEDRTGSLDAGRGGASRSMSGRGSRPPAWWATP
jgi:hypothetical protein